LKFIARGRYQKILFYFHFYFLFIFLTKQIPLFDEDDPKALLTSMLQLVGKPPLEELKRMPTACKMDKDGIELITHLTELPDDQTKIKFSLKEVTIC
jgi:hypothetical protein